jgi:hypothetical protein
MPDRMPCALCMIDGVFSESVDGWPGIPSCEAHVIACGGVVERAVIVPRPRFAVIEGGKTARRVV